MHTIPLPFRRESAHDVIVRMISARAFLPDHAIGTAPPAAVPAARPKLAATLGHALSRLADGFDRWAWTQQMEERERYLAQSTDIFDLERRIRTLERGDR
jgi:hypothetical protein